MIFLSLKYAEIFLGREKKNRGISGVVKKRTKGFFLVMLKKLVILLGRQILKL